MRAGLRGFLRYAIGLVLLATAAGKLLDIRGFAGVLDTYRAFPPWALTPLAAAVSVTELVLALWLFAGRRVVAAAAASSLLHAGYAAWSAVSLLRGLRLPNCGCFGVFLVRPLGWNTVIEDLALAAASVALLLLSMPERRTVAG